MSRQALFQRFTDVTHWLQPRISTVIWAVPFVGVIVMNPPATFSHGGDTGDLIYALATVKSLGGGRLRLMRNDRVREPFTPEKVEVLRIFLELQPYVTGVEYGDTPSGFNLDDWRRHCRRQGLRITFLRDFGT